jgi:hypothetical protein
MDFCTRPTVRFRADLLHEPVAVLHGLGEVVAGIDVEQRKGSFDG